MEQDSLQLVANRPDPAVCAPMCVVGEKRNSLYVWRFLLKEDCFLNFQMSLLHQVFLEVNGGKKKEKTLLFSHEGETSILTQKHSCI